MLQSEAICPLSQSKTLSLSSKAAVKVSVGTGVSSEDLNKEGPLLSFHVVVGRAYFSGYCL